MPPGVNGAKTRNSRGPFHLRRSSSAASPRKHGKLQIAGVASPVFIVQVVLIAWITYERDATAMFHRSWAIRESPNISVKAKPSGKWRTIICFPSILLFHLILHPFGSILFGWIDTFVIVIISTYDYVKSYRQAIRLTRGYPS